jgi:hypothetical protein
MMGAAFPGLPAGTTEERPAATPRRVRHEVRDGVAVIMFSAAASTALAVLLVLLLTLAGQGA